MFANLFLMLRIDWFFLTKGLSQHLNRKHISFLFKCASTSHPPSHPSFLICFLLQPPPPPFVMLIWWLNDGENTHSETFPDSKISTYSSGEKKRAAKQKRERVSQVEILKGALQRDLPCIKCPYTCVYLGSDVLSMYVHRSSWMIQSTSCCRCGT